MKTKILGFVVIFLAFFMFAEIASASTAEIIQPASIIYNENMTVNGELNVKSLRVGSEGVGGVTYFNGTIVNVGQDIPVTFGDDVRIDGMIWRGPSKGTSDGQALKIGDSMYPAITNINSLGSTNKRWRDLFLAGVLFGEDMVVGRELWGGSHKGIVDGDDPIFVSDSMYPTLDDINNLGSADNRWNDLYLSGNLQGVNATFTGDVDFSGATVTGLAAGGSDADTLDGLDSTDFLQLSGGTMTGNINMGSNDITVGGDIKWDTPRVSYVSVQGSACVGNYVINHEDLCRGDGSANIMTAYYNVSLPHESTITAFRGFFNDSNGSNDIQCRLKSQPTTGTSDNQDVLAIVTSLGSGGYQTFDDTSISYDPVVDNSNKSYSIECLSTTASSPVDVYIYGLRVTYTKDSVD